MQFSEIIDELDSIETNFPVNEWKAGDVHIWPLLRINLRNQLLYTFNKNTYNEAMINKRPGIQAYALSALKSIYFTSIAAVKDRKNNKRIKGEFDILFHTVTQDRILLDESYYNRLCDPFIDKLDVRGIKSAVIESSPLPIKLRFPRFRCSEFIQNHLTLARMRSMVKTRILGMKLPVVKLDHYERLQDYMLEKYNIIIWDRNKINEQTVLLFDLKRCYSDIISRGKFRMGIITMYYSIDGMAFVLACKEQGIITCDLQHGLQGDYHVAYGLWNKVSQKGYEVLPRYFLCWSKLEADAIKKWNFNVQNYHSPVVIGNLFIEKWKNNLDPHVRKYDAICCRIMNDNPGKKHVLYTLQDYSIPEWILNVIKETEGNLFWWIRMHPEMVQKSADTLYLLRNHGITGYNLAEATSLPLYAILRNVSIHVTGWSTTVLEASEFGIPSLITDKLGKEVYHNEINSGIAFMALDKQNLLDILGLVTHQKRKLVFENNSESSFSEFEYVISELEKHQNDLHA